MTSSPVLWAGYAIVLALFTYLAIVKMENLPPHLRFQPPLLIVILTLFVSLLLSAEPDASPAVIDTLMRLNDSFSHLLFWVLVATLLNVTHILSYRAIGSASGLYAVGSIIWVLFLSNTTAMGNLIVVVVIYAFSLVAMLLGLGRRDKGTPRDAAAQPVEPPLHEPAYIRLVFRSAHRAHCHSTLLSLSRYTCIICRAFPMGSRSYQPRFFRRTSILCV